MIGDPLRAPDPERPEFWFIDDGRIYQVGIHPAVMPVFMRADIVRLWGRGQFTNATPMTSLELSRARRETAEGDQHRPPIPSQDSA